MDAVFYVRVSKGAASAAIASGLKAREPMGESVRTLLQDATSALACSSPSAALDARLLLAFVLGETDAWLRARPEHEPDDAERKRFAELIVRRRAGEPIAYLRGSREFWSMQLRVNADVLVPRPETEGVVEAALARIPPDARWRVLDLGTGSGAIALAIARERPHCTITATDVSSAALAVARDNAAALQTENVLFRCGAWYDAVLDERFHLIAANPPYVSDDHPRLRDDGLRHEPRLALTGGPDGMRDLRTIIAGAPARLERGGMIVLEHGYDQRDAVTDALLAGGFELVQCYQDLAGLDRVSAARLSDVS
jgi:release factor glutamine methyltransferase